MAEMSGSASTDDWEVIVARLYDPGNQRTVPRNRCWSMVRSRKLAVSTPARSPWRPTSSTNTSTSGPMAGTSSGGRRRPGGRPSCRAIGVPGR
jgi:hypothetical protein